MGAINISKFLGEAPKISAELLPANATLSELLAGSTDLARRLATEADEWSVQAVMLQSAWPK
jgi:DNA-binding transcriptional regulator PaaX